MSFHARCCYYYQHLPPNYISHKSEGGNHPTLSLSLSLKICPSDTPLPSSLDRFMYDDDVPSIITPGVLVWGLIAVLRRGVR